MQIEGALNDLAHQTAPASSRLGRLEQLARVAGVPTRESQSGGGISGLKRFMSAPALPDVATRVGAVLDSIDPSAPTISVWVPGTSEYWANPRWLRALDQHAPTTAATFVPYQAAWRFTDSVPDGVAVLRGTLEALAARGDTRPVVLAGESQGAWVIAEAMRDPATAARVDRAALWGLPAAAPQHVDGLANVRITRNPDDLVCMDLGSSTGSAMAGVEHLARGRFLRGAGSIGSVIVRKPSTVGRLAGQWAHNLPGVGSRHADPHVYADDFAAGAAWLHEGR